MVQQHCLEDIKEGVRESTPRRDHPVGSEDLLEELQGNSEESQPTEETKDDAEARSGF